MRRRDFPGALFASAAGLALYTEPARAQSGCTSLFFGRTHAELDARVSVVNEYFPPGDVRRYGAVGDGFTNDQQALMAAIAQFARSGGAPLWFEPGKTYFLGDQASGATVLRIESAARNVIYGNGATLRVNTIDGSAPVILQLADCRHITIQSLRGTDSGANYEICRGAVGFDIVATGQDDADVGHITLDDCVVENATAFLRVRGDSAGQFSTNQANRIRNIRVRGGLARHVFYGINCQNHGDDVSVDLHMESVFRAYFVYGVTGHQFRVYVRKPHGGYSQCLIKSYDRSTANIKGSLHFEESHSLYECITLEFQNGVQAQTIEDVEIDLNCKDAASNAIPLTFRAFDEAGAVRPTTDNRWDNLRFSGAWPENAAPIAFATTCNVPVRLVLDPALATALPSSPQYGQVVVSPQTSGASKTVQMPPLRRSGWARLLPSTTSVRR